MGKIKTTLLDFLKKSNSDTVEGNVNKVDSEEFSSSILVENFKGVLQYICDDFERSILLSKYLKNELTEIFGKYNTRYKGEFYFYVWVVEFEGEIFNIFTDNRKGTYFEIVANYGDNKSAVCKRFLRKIEQLIINLHLD